MQFTPFILDQSSLKLSVKMLFLYLLIEVSYFIEVLGLRINGSP